MALNPIPTGPRTHAMSSTLTAGGGFTAPQHAFIPHPSTQAFGHGPQIAGAQQRSGGSVPASRGVSNNLPSTSGQVYGIRGGVR